MAIVNNFNRDPDDTSNQQQSGQQDQQTQASAPKQTSGASTYGSSAAPTIKDSTPQNSSSNTSGTSSGSFQNLQNYVSANKDFNAGGGGLGGKVASTVTNQGNNINNQFNNAQNDFSTQEQANRVTEDPNLISQLSADPTAIANNANSLSALQKYLTGTYSGPTNIDATTSQNLQNQAQNFAGTAALGGTESGRSALLTKLYGGSGNYNQGMNLLDNAVIQSSPDQINAIAATANQGTNLVNTINNTLTSNTAQAKQDQQAAQQAASDANAAIQAKTDSLSKAAAAQAAAYNTALSTNNTAADQAYSGAVAEAQKGQLTGAELANSGLHGGNSLWGVDASKYINQTPQNTTQENQYNSLTPEQLQAMQALVKINPALASSLGQYTAASNPTTSNDPYSYNGSALSAAVAHAQQPFLTAGNALIDPKLVSGFTGYNPKTTSADQLYGLLQQQAQHYTDDIANQTNIINQHGNATAEQTQANSTQRDADRQQAAAIQSLLDKYAPQYNNKIVQTTQAPGQAQTTVNGIQGRGIATTPLSVGGVKGKSL